MSVKSITSKSTKRSVISKRSQKSKRSIKSKKSKKSNEIKEKPEEEEIGLNVQQMDMMTHICLLVWEFLIN